MKYFLTIFAGVWSAIAFAQESQRDTITGKENELKEVVIQNKKKAVERKADRTIFDFSEQSYLNSASLLEGLKKLPGLIVSDIAGMMYQGKVLEVYLDGRPLNIYSNELNSYLEGMPANVIEKVEIITNPGAEFPATSGGAIINIITSKSAKKYLSATYTNGYNYSKYSKSRHRFSNSLTLNAANNLFSWQIQAGQNYRENYRDALFTNDGILISDNYSDMVNRFYYVNSGIKFDLKRDRILINYDISSNNGTSQIEASGLGFTTSDRNKTKTFYHDVAATYQMRFANPNKKLDFRLNYNNNDSRGQLDSRTTGARAIDNLGKQDYYLLRIDYNQELEFLDNTKISSGLFTEKMDFTTFSFGNENLDYSRTTLSAYGEAQAEYKSFEFILGGRLESYDIGGAVAEGKLMPFNQTRFFPNATIQYNVAPQVYANANYNKKITLPSTAALNPNTTYQNPNVGFYGNPYLEPTIYNNFELRLSAFEYFTIGYSISDASNAIINRIITTQSGIANVTENLKKVSYQNFNFGIPLPYMLFSKGLTETLKMDFNPDEINFMFIYAGNQKQIIPDTDTRSFWNFNVMSQILLPKKVKFTVNYTTSTTGGTYYYYTLEKPFGNQVDVTFAKKFLSDNLSLSVYLNDVFNSNRQEFGLIGTDLNYKSRYDTRRAGFSLSYKIPTKNKLAKESNILNKEKKQEENGVGL